MQLSRFVLTVLVIAVGIDHCAAWWHSNPAPYGAGAPGAAFWSPQGAAGQMPEFKFLAPDNYGQGKVNALLLEDNEDNAPFEALEKKSMPTQAQFDARVDQDTQDKIQAVKDKAEIKDTGETHDMMKHQQKKFYSHMQKWSDDYR